MKKNTSNSKPDINWIVHEIGNPLNGILTSIQLLERHLASHNQAGDEFFNTSLQNLKSEINRLQGILSDARSLAQNDAQGPTDPRRATDPVLSTQNRQKQSGNKKGDEREKHYTGKY